MAINRSRAILYGCLYATVCVLTFIMVHGLRTGWGELSDPGYWVGNALVWVITAAVFAVGIPRGRSSGRHAEPGAAPDRGGR